MILYHNHNYFKSAVAFFFLFFLYGFSIGTRQQGISFNITNIEDKMTTAEISRIVDKTTMTVLRYAKKNNLGIKISSRSTNSAYIFTEKEVKKIVENFTKG